MHTSNRWVQPFHFSRARREHHTFFARPNQPYQFGISHPDSTLAMDNVFCTRLSGVAADAVVLCAMRHTSPETKRRYQLGMTDQVREAVEKANKKAYG
jgi:hypothetical protein